MEPTGDSRRATRAVVDAPFEGMIAEGSTRTERNTALERPGAWALQGRARDGLKREPEAKERAGALEDRPEATDSLASPLAEARVAAPPGTAALLSLLRTAGITA